MAALLELELVKVTAARRAPTKGKTAAPPEEEENDDGGNKEEDESLEGEEYDDGLEEPDLYAYRRVPNPTYARDTYKVKAENKLNKH